ncbi:ribonuclease HII [Planococcus sp. YIM B11945]|uniref:ribonuclease HII n=1 Tax=Planococcus sp. YIM B11945 TaxID=3435410 RepID=UPI003D7E5D42
METVTAIKEKLKAANQWEPWMDELAQDSRKSIQTLIAQWHKRQNSNAKLLHNHEKKIQFDQSYKKHPTSLVAGIDEAGRGPLAGPVVTAAVILPEDCTMLIGLDDSKKLSKAKRNYFADMIREVAVSYAVHIQPPVEIDRCNIYQATRLSMTKAALQLNSPPAIVLADAMMLDLPMPCESIIKGDAKSLAIAAASILAKTTRDKLMDSYADEFPGYGFDKHAGYGTPEHLEALRNLGPCPIHRKTFEPIKSLLMKTL